MYNNYSFEVTKIFKNAEIIMLELNHAYVGTEHLLLSMLKVSDSINKLMTKYGLTYDDFLSELNEIVGKTKNNPGIVIYTPLLKRVIKNAQDLAKKNKVTATDLLISLLEEGEGIAIRIMLGMHLDLDSLYDELKKACPLRDEVIGDGFDMVIMRELTGGLYFGERHTEEIDGVRTAVDTLSYNENEIRRIAIKAFDIARKRKKHVISVDKANVLDSSRLWRAVVEEVAKDYEDVTYEHMLVDNCAMQLVNNPRQFDVILTENMFGDILSDEASMITGSIGMLSSASLAEGKFGLYEPSHGSAPDIAGQDIANPIATILSAAMMLRYSFDLDKEADEIEAAVKAVLADGYRTVDIMSDGMKKVGCKEMGQLIIDKIK